MEFDPTTTRARRRTIGTWAAIILTALVSGILVLVSTSQAVHPQPFTADAPNVVFNHAIDNPVAGDERNFLRAAKPGGEFSDHVTGLVDGQEVTLQIYVHNNAASVNGPPAKDARVVVRLPSTFRQSPVIGAIIKANNSHPPLVTDVVQLSGVKDGFMELAYVPGSARLTSNAGDLALSDDIVNNGALIGSSAADGIFSAGPEYSAWVTLRVKVNMPNFSVQTSVRIQSEGPDRWRESANAAGGDLINVLVEFRNVGSTTLADIAAVVQLPHYLAVVPGTVRLVNNAYPLQEQYPYSAAAVQVGDGVEYVNVNVGSYAPNSNGYLQFTAKAVVSPGIGCGNQRLAIRSYATPDGYGAVNSDAYIIVVNDQGCPS